MQSYESILLSPRMHAYECLVAFSNVFPVWVITLGSVCFLFGGGPIVALALLFVMLSDITPKAQL